MKNILSVILFMMSMSAYADVSVSCNYGGTIDFSPDEIAAYTQKPLVILGTKVFSIEVSPRDPDVAQASNLHTIVVIVRDKAQPNFIETAVSGINHLMYTDAKFDGLVDKYLRLDCLAQ